MPTGQYDGGNSLIKVLSSKETLVCVKLTETNQHTSTDPPFTEKLCEWSDVIFVLIGIHKAPAMLVDADLALRAEPMLPFSCLCFISSTSEQILNFKWTVCISTLDMAQLLPWEQSQPPHK